MASSDLVQALSRGLMLLELLANAEGGMTLQQLSQELDLKPATVHNLLRTLMARSYVEKLAKPTRYTLGVSLLELVEQYRGRELQRRVGKAMTTIFTRFSFARVTYSEAIGGEVFLKLRITPERPGLLERPWNSTMLPYTSASVLVFQAYWQTDQRQIYNQRYPFAEYGAHLWQSEANLESFLADVRARGYSAPPVERNGLIRVAVPVFDSGSHIAGALGAAATVSLGEDDDPQHCQQVERIRSDFVQALKAAAAGLNQADSAR
jgi:DNA-binding IclR family transcriptional regulator